jgi:hypothetical protein
MVLFTGRLGGRDEEGGRQYEVEGDRAGRSWAISTIGS